MVSDTQLDEFITYWLNDVHCVLELEGFLLQLEPAGDNSTADVEQNRTRLIGLLNEMLQNIIAAKDDCPRLVRCFKQKDNRLYADFTFYLLYHVFL